MGGWVGAARPVGVEAGGGVWDVGPGCGLGSGLSVGAGGTDGVSRHALKTKGLDAKATFHCVCGCGEWMQG